jgi:hypothetical protein
MRIGALALADASHEKEHLRLLGPRGAFMPAPATSAATVRPTAGIIVLFIWLSSLRVRVRAGTESRGWARYLAV